MSKNKFKDPWISISDMMTGLMMIFLFITVSYTSILKSESEEVIEKQDSIEEIVLQLIDRRSEIADDLHEEFDDDLDNWNASIDDESLSFRFESPDVLFGAGDASISPIFEEILVDFWPRYLQILNNHSQFIDEIKIEGHTSSEWRGNISREESYFKNMKLSQDRARNVVEYCFINTPEKLKEWSISTITANGFSFSRLKYDESGNEDAEKSRRVEFTILIDAEKSLEKISETL